MTTLQRVFFACLCISGLALSGCTGRSDPSRFYLLQPEQLESKLSEQRIALTLAQVKIPEYAQRPQLFVANQSGSFEIMDSHRWAEPLASNLTRVLKQNLAQNLPAQVSISRSASVNRTSPLHVAVEITDITLSANTAVALRASWQLYSLGQTAGFHEFQCLLPAENGEDFQPSVSALNKCVYRLAIEISDQVKKLSDPDNRRI